MNGSVMHEEARLVVRAAIKDDEDEVALDVEVDVSEEALSKLLHPKLS